MERRSQQLGGVLLLSMGLVSGGASASQANTASDGIDSGAVVEMVVINRTPGTVTAYVEWRGAGGRVPLGEVRGRQTRIFVTPHRDLEFRLSLNVLSTPPVLTGAATRRREPTQSFVTVYPGERYEWEIRQTYPTIELFYLRVPRTSRLAGDMIRARAVIPAAAPGSRPSAGGSSSRRMLFAPGSGRDCRGLLRRGGRWRVAVECRLAKPTRRRAGCERDQGRGSETPLAKP